MQGIVDQILEGKYDYENGSLDFSCAKLELAMHKGEVCEGSFHVYSSGDSFTQGYVTATDMRMECLTPEFSGSKEEIFYCFHGEHMEEGDVVKGNFCIVSNRGEYYLPFVIAVEHQTLESSIGHVKNLFHFANLAKCSWREAVALFYSPEFVSVFTGSDRQFYDAYRGLCVYPGNEQNVEEFLIRINKKHKTEFVVQESEIVREFSAAAYGVTETELDILRNGWGYTALQVECEGEFVFTEKEFIGDDDFVGNHCRLPVFIDTQLCRPGRNFGRIYLYNSYVSIIIPVTVCMGEHLASRRERLQRKRDIVRLMECYQDFRMKKIAAATWQKETGAIVETMVQRDEEDMTAKLFQAQLLISEERYNEAGWILNSVEDTVEELAAQDDTILAYYLYLTTLLNQEEDYVNQVAARVEKLYGQNPNNWRIAWLLLYLSEEYNKTAAAKWEFLEQQFGRGCSSPILYIESLHLLNGNPTLLRKIDDYALQILNYGVRQDVLQQEVVEQLLYLVGRGRGCSPVLLKILQQLYGKSQDVRILQEICTLLVRGNRVGLDYFEWYEAGVEAQLRITNLYEYYMMSLDLRMDRTLPRMVLMYFSYQNNLDLAHSAFLYCYVVQHKEELGELYESYRPRIEYFVVDQIQKEHINRYLAELYREMLSPAMINEQTADALARLLFAHRICVEDSRLKKVIVYQPGNLKENVYPLQEGCVWVPLYGNDATILFEDAYGNRFVKSVEYELEKLMIPGRFLRLISGLVTDSTELDLYLNEHETETPAAEIQDRVLRLSGNAQVDERIRRKLYLKHLQNCYEADDMRTLDQCLDSIPMDLLTLEEHGEVLRYMVLRGRIDTAWEWVQQLGPSFIEPNILLRLVSERIAGGDNAEDAMLTEAALYTFRRGKHDSCIVRYLAQYARCSTKELRDVWKAAQSYEVDAYRLSERILLQMLFSGAFVGERMKIFDYYVSRGADPRLEEAFLSRCSYDYFVKERLTDAIVFREIRRIYQEQGESQRVCKLAFLKYYSDNMGEITPEILSLIGVFLQEMLSEQIHLNFFRNFMGMEFAQEYQLREMMDKTIVEYRARPGSKAYIHYVLMRESGEASEYLTEPMREVYGGLCFKEFVLFFGENLQYYITEEHDGQEQLTQSGNLQRSDIRGDGADGRYEMLNDIVISRTLEDCDTLDGLLEEYCRREYLNEQLFALQ
jgi:hypothetical protein